MIYDNKIEILMAEIHHIRRTNLRLLRSIAETDFRQNHPNQSYKDYMFAEYIGLSKSFYSQIKKPENNHKISEKTARSIEKHIDLPLCWMDKDHETNDYENVFLDGYQIKKIALLFKDFISLPHINFELDAKDERLAKTIESVIVKTSKYQDTSIDDFISFYLKQ